MCMWIRVEKRKLAAPPCMNMRVSAMTAIRWDKLD
jgi:hypothetical protein